MTAFKYLALVLTALTLSSPFAAHAEEGDTINFRFSPVEVLLTTAHVNFDFAIAPSWTLGPELILGQYTLGSSSIFTEYKVTNVGIGARANWMKNGVYTSGLYVAPSLTFQQVKVTAKDNLGGSTEASASVPMLNGLVGYAWFWRSFNMMLGGGLSFPLGNPSIKVKDSTGYEKSVTFSRFSGLALEYSLGWTF